MKTLIVFLAFAGAAMAQGFTLTVQDTSLIASPTVQDVIAAGILTNTSSAPIGIIAKRRTNVADTTWNTAVCMAICMGPTFDTAGAYDIPPGGTQLFLLHFTPSNVPGANSVDMEWYSPDDTVHAIKQTFHLSTASPTQFTWPARGQSMIFGVSDTIRWTSPLTEDAQLALSTDAGETWTELAASVPLSAGMYVWTPPARFVNIAKLRLRTTEGSVISDLSKLTAQFFSPVNGDTVHSGTPVTVRWTPGISGTAEFDYQIGNGSWVKVTSSVSLSSGQYTWTPSASLNDKAVKVRLKTADWIFNSDPFIVAAPSAIAELMPTATALTASPNPTHDAITFTSTVSNIRQITVMDVLGRTVMVAPEQSSGTSATLDLARLPAGLYRGIVSTRSGLSVIPFSVIR